MKYFTALASLTLTFSASCAFAEMGMKHGAMQMQGRQAPADARDPNAYSGGYTLTEGPYAQSGPRQLKLADEHAFWAIQGERLEYQHDSESLLFDVNAWYGTTYDRLTIKAEGELAEEQESHHLILEESSTDILWSHAVNAYFDTQLGLRLDQYREGKHKKWLALGFQGLAPYWFELDITVYLGENGRTALSSEAEYELLLTQRWILQTRAEANFYSQHDSDNELGAGLSSLEIGIRLRYEYTRQFSPYIGVEWGSTYGQTADYRSDAGGKRSDTQLVSGLKFTF